MLQTAIKVAHARQWPPAARVEPIGLFAAAAATLTSLLNKNMLTTLSSELEMQLSEVRAHWHATYLDGMHVALGINDKYLLGKALILGKELQDNGLLVDSRDRDIYREIDRRLQE